MSDVVVLEFSAGDAGDIYRRVNRILGLDGPDPEWPAGMLSHVAAEGDSTLVVVEEWESKADQQAFMESRLGPALHEVSAPQPTRAEWFSQIGAMHRHEPHA